MGKKKRGLNEYTICGEYTVLHYKNYKGNEFEILIDTEDLPRLIKDNYYWTANYFPKIDNYYAKCGIYLGKGSKPLYKNIYLHRYIMNLNENNKNDVHHKNHTATLDNRKSNLEVLNRESNARDRRGKNSNNKSGYRNVSWINKKWAVQLQVDGKNTKLGEFDDVHEAGRFAEEMRKKYYNEHAGNT